MAKWAQRAKWTACPDPYVEVQFSESAAVSGVAEPGSAPRPGPYRFASRRQVQRYAADQWAGGNT